MVVYADIELVNGEDLVLLRLGHIDESQVRKLSTKAMVDSGAYYMGINERINAQLQLPVKRMVPATLADGQIVELSLVGPLEVRFENRVANVDALVLPGNTNVLLGAIPMEDMDVLVDPRNQRLIVNPEHPMRAQTIMA
jgi:clan AA aspartic protease